MSPGYERSSIKCPGSNTPSPPIARTAQKYGIDACTPTASGVEAPHPHALHRRRRSAASGKKSQRLVNCSPAGDCCLLTAVANDAILSLRNGDTMTQVATGTLLAGKYRLESLIGRGGMGSVWRAEHLALSAPVAVKLLDQFDFAGSAEALSRFHREARAAAAIRSPHVVQTFDHGVDETLGLPFIVMELMDGESLADRLTRCGRVGPAEAARIFTHVARALSRAHEAGIVHRDLKPDNVFLVRNEDEEIAKVLDFGIAKAQTHALGANSATATGTVMGTAYYMSPEQISGARVDFRTDLWALGVMACESLTGRRPFEAGTMGAITLKICVAPIPAPSSFAPVPAGFDQWFLRMVNRDVSQRFPSAREAADSLRQVCRGEAADERLSSPPPQVDPMVQPSSAATGGPLSRSASDVSGANRPQRKGVSPWVVGVGLASAVGATLWLRANANHATEAAIPSASAPARLVAAATNSNGLEPPTSANTANHDPGPAPEQSARALPDSAASTSATAPATPPQSNTQRSPHLGCKPCPAQPLATTTASAAQTPIQNVKTAQPEVPKPSPPPAPVRDLLDSR